MSKTKPKEVTQKKYLCPKCHFPVQYFTKQGVVFWRCPNCLETNKKCKSVTKNKARTHTKIETKIFKNKGREIMNAPFTQAELEKLYMDTPPFVAIPKISKEELDEKRLISLTKNSLLHYEMLLALQQQIICLEAKIKILEDQAISKEEFYKKQIDSAQYMLRKISNKDYTNLPEDYKTIDREVLIKHFSENKEYFESKLREELAKHGRTEKIK